MNREEKLERNFPFYLAIVGVVLTLFVFIMLVSDTIWHPVWNSLMLASIVLAAAGTGLLKIFRQWGAFALVVGGMGVFFSFLLAYADNIQVLGYQYPLVLFAMAPLCVSGIWVAVENISDEDDDPPPAKQKSKQQSDEKSEPASTDEDSKDN
jgi:hypothetical protein